ncbi:MULTISPECIES: serine/threonine-protein kinase [unclassified Streptomyces]|uniref:serine/threonine-protein kinase n=1 Tax=unclassified Streptomyces TaxID=2593676 RepID=UPI00336AD9D0
MGTDSQGAQRLVAGRYRLTEVLGRGGMGVVWRATDELIGRAVAVKELRTPAGLSAQERSTFAERALREARTAGRLNHPGVVAIYDLVPATPEDDAIYIVMELVEAPSLAELLEQNEALAEERVARMAGQLLDALDAAHSIGLVHRDIKPSNIMVLPGDQVKLVDFGIAHALDDTRLTRHGIAGSTGYMAPELFQGADPSPATDLWSLGATLFHAIEGHDPFARQTPAATLHAILRDDLPPLNCHPPLSTLITGLLTRDTADRMTSQEVRALLPSTTTGATATPPTAEPARPRQAMGEDRATTVRPTTTPPHTPSSSPADSRQATWESHPTTIKQHTDTLSPNPAPDSPPTDPPLLSIYTRIRAETLIVNVIALIFFCGVLAFFYLRDDSSDDVELKAKARVVTLEFIQAYSMYDFDNACELVVPRAHVSSDMKFPECGNAEERRKSEARKLTDPNRGRVDNLAIKSVELAGNSKAHVVVSMFNATSEWILRRSGDSWLIELQ